jgi:hypothetical protein
MKIHTSLAILFSAVAFAAPAPIGMVTAPGHFQLEGSRIWGNSTLFDGALVETGDASSELALSNGVKVQLGAASSARVWKGRLELERGSGQVTSKSAFRVSAAGMAIEGSRYRVAIGSDARMQVVALAGDARVLSAQGALLGAVPAGRSMSFALAQALTRTGCLLYKANGFILQSENPVEVLQLTGDGLAAQVGNRVQITGVPTAAQATISPATRTVNVSSLTRVSAGGCLSAAAALTAQAQMPAGAATAANAGAPSPAPQAAKTGMSTGAKVAIIGGIAGGATAGIVYAATKDDTSN